MHVLYIFPLNLYSSHRQSHIQSSQTSKTHIVKFVVLEGKREKMEENPEKYTQDQEQQRNSEVHAKYVNRVDRVKNVLPIDMHPCPIHIYVCIALLSRFGLSSSDSTGFTSLFIFQCKLYLSLFLSLALSSPLFYLLRIVTVLRIYFLDVQGTLPYTSICKLHFLFRCTEHTLLQLFMLFRPEPE